MSSTALQSDIRTLAAQVAQARGLVEQGQEVDAAALDDAVGAVCERAAKASGPDAPATREALEALRAEVGALAEALDARLASMRETLSDTQRRRQAVSAYAGGPKNAAPKAR